MMKRKIMASMLAGVLTAGMVVGTAGAAATGTTMTGTGTGTVYSPQDIIDVIVPTEFKIAFNPLQVSISNSDGLSGSTQILSGTYAIQNRSTVPVNVAASFKVTADGKLVKAASAADVAAYDAQDPSKVTMAEFSLDLATTAKGTTQSLTGTVADKSGDDKLRTDAAVSGVKITKTSTETIPLTAAASKDVNFMLAAGPYTPTYNKDTDKIEYTVSSKGTFDTVAFSFTGTTTTSAAKWAAVTTAPSITATYTLTESSQSAYDAQPFSAYSKSVTIKTGETDVKVTASADAEYTFATAPALTMSGDDVDGAKNKVTVLSLLANAKADATKSLDDLGITVTETDGTYKATISKDTAIEAGFYLLTIGKQSFTVEVQK